jgi:hypothetical protein
MKGMDAALRDLERLQKEAKQAARRAEKRIADRIAAEAIAAAAGSRKALIGVTQTENGTLIAGGDDLSAWVEFGTGEFAARYLSTQPPEVVEEARKFFRNGKGRTGAQPFFLPAVYRNIPGLLPAIEAELKKITK